MKKAHFLLIIISFLCLMSFTSCITDEEVDDGLSCSLDEDCPDGWICEYSTKLCIDPNASTPDSDTETTDNPANTDNDTEVADNNASDNEEADIDNNDPVDNNEPVDNEIPDVDNNQPLNYPVVVSSVPEKNATDVDKNTSIKITFNMPMKVADLRVNSNIILSEKETSTDIDMDESGASYNNADHSLTIPLETALKEATLYQIRMLNSITSESGATLNNGTIMSPKPEILLFETVAPPVISTTTPVDGAVNIESTLNEFKVYFSETVDPSQLTAVLNSTELIENETTQGTAYTFPITGGTFSAGTTYEILVAGAKDLKGIQMADTTVSFTTKYTAAPVIVSRSPEADAVDVPLMTKSTINFSHKMDAATINSSRITLKRVVGDTRVDITPAPVVTLSDLKDSAIISAEYKAGNKYEITVTAGASGVKNASGIAMAGNNAVWQFTLKESEILLETEFDTNDGLFLVTDKGVNDGWVIDTTDKRAEISLTGAGYYQDDVDSWLYTAAPVDLTTSGAFLEFSLMISTYWSSVDDDDNDGVEIVIWDTDSETMLTGTALPKSAITGTDLTNLNSFQSHEGFCGFNSAGTYFTYKVDLTGKIGTKIGIAFRFISNDSWDKKNGAWIDNIKIIK